MPSPATHIIFGLLLMIIFLFGIVFPDIDKLSQKAFWKNKCWKAVFDENKCPEYTFHERGKLHNWFLWSAIVLFALGCLIHLTMDLYIIK